VINGWEVGELQHTHGARWKVGTVGWVAGIMILFLCFARPADGHATKISNVAKAPVGWARAGLAGTIVYRHLAVARSVSSIVWLVLVSKTNIGQGFAAGGWSRSWGQRTAEVTKRKKGAWEIPCEWTEWSPPLLHHYCVR
jgi:hypothetical protein